MHRNEDGQEVVGNLDPVETQYVLDNKAATGPSFHSMIYFLAAGRAAGLHQNKTKN